MATLLTVTHVYKLFTSLFLLLCRARGRPDQRRTETLCGTPGAPGVNVPGRVEEARRTRSDDASVPSKDALKPFSNQICIVRVIKLDLCIIND